MVTHGQWGATWRLPQPGTTTSSAGCTCRAMGHPTSGSTPCWKPTQRAALLTWARPGWLPCRSGDASTLTIRPTSLQTSPPFAALADHLQRKPADIARRVVLLASDNELAKVFADRLVQASGNAQSHDSLRVCVARPGQSLLVHVRRTVRRLCSIPKPCPPASVLAPCFSISSTRLRALRASVLERNAWRENLGTNYYQPTEAKTPQSRRDRGVNLRILEQFISIRL